MKKRILSVLTAVVLVLGLLPAGALAAEEETPAQHTDHTGWTAINNETELRDATKGNYYLTQDITINSNSRSWVPDNGVVLCLNGHSIIDNGNYYVIAVSYSFTLTDCGGENHQTGQITHGEASQSGGAGVLVDGTNANFTMYGGSITGNKISSYGGGVYVYSNSGAATFNMFGGSITGNNANAGGGVYVDQNGTFNMSGGEISGNQAVDTNDKDLGIGGGIYVSSEDNGGTLNVSGNAVVTGNWTGSSDSAYSKDTASNVYLPRGKKLAISDDLTAGANIGIKKGYPDTDPTIATGAKSGDEKYFSSDVSGYEVAVDNGKLVFQTASSTPAATEQVGIYLRTLDATVTENPTSDNFVEIPNDQMVALGLKYYYKRANEGYWVDYGSFQSEKAATYEKETQNRGSDNVKAVIAELQSANVTVNSDNANFKVPLTSSAITWDTLSRSNGSWHLNGELHVCKVTFDLNYDGATATRYSIKGTDSNSGLPTDPERTDYTFGGWYTQAEGGDKVEAIGVLNDNVTYYAHWTEKSGGDSQPEEHKHFLCGETHTDIGNHTSDEKIEFATKLWMDGDTLMMGNDAWTKSTVKRADGGREQTGYVLAQGEYYLYGDITLSDAAILINGDVKLCLNGHTIDRANKTGGADYVIWVLGQDNAHLTLTDCKGTGKLTGGQYGGVDVFGSCTLDMYGGTITGNEYNGGVNIGQLGKFNMYGGEISGNSAKYSGGGVSTNAYPARSARQNRYRISSLIR